MSSGTLSPQMRHGTPWWPAYRWFMHNLRILHFIVICLPLMWDEWLDNVRNNSIIVVMIPKWVTWKKTVHWGQILRSLPMFWTFNHLIFNSSIVLSPSAFKWIWNVYEFLYSLRFLRLLSIDFHVWFSRFPFGSRQTNVFGYLLFTAVAYIAEDWKENVNCDAWKVRHKPLWKGSLRQNWSWEYLGQNHSLL